MRQRIGQDMLSIVMKSDRDNDNYIDRKEAKTLALRIRLALQEYGVDFDSEKVNMAVHSSSCSISDFTWEIRYNY